MHSLEKRFEALSAYLIEKMTVTEVGKKFNIDRNCLYYWLKKYGIKPRPSQYRGEKNGNRKGIKYEKD